LALGRPVWEPRQKGVTGAWKIGGKKLKKRKKLVI